MSSSVLLFVLEGGRELVGCRKYNNTIQLCNGCQYTNSTTRYCLQHPPSIVVLSNRSHSFNTKQDQATCYHKCCLQQHTNIDNESALQKCRGHSTRELLLDITLLYWHGQETESWIACRWDSLAQNWSRRIISVAWKSGGMLTSIARATSLSYFSFRLGYHVGFKFYRLCVVKLSQKGRSWCPAIWLLTTRTPYFSFGFSQAELQTVVQDSQLLML